jgi:hypothetical protein
VRDSFFRTSSNCRTMAGGREMLIIWVVRMDYSYYLVILISIVAGQTVVKLGAETLLRPAVCL